RHTRLVSDWSSDVCSSDLSIRHPFTVVGPHVKVGAGTCMAPGSVITTHVTIGQHVIVNVRVSISHDCVVGDYVNVNPGAVICGKIGRASCREGVWHSVDRG